jgi:hypothetical protein
MENKMVKKILLVIFFISSLSIAQDITWEELTSQYSLPGGIEVFKGRRESPQLNIFYIDVDMNVDSLVVRPYIASKTNLKSFTSNVGAYAAINSGFFGGDASFSSVVYPGEVKAANVTALSRNSKTYPVLRSMISMNNERQFSINWIYHHGGSVDDIYWYDDPLPYTNNDPNPLPAPTKQNGNQFENLLIGMGGAPTLVKSGEANVTYNEEVMWGSGVGLSNGDPRTAVGYTEDNHLIMLVADGRQATSTGVSLTELAEIMIDLGCVEAMNLDGGGSSQMAVPGEYINNPSEQRSVPTILAVTHIDSLGLPKEPLYEHIIDTGDERAIENGTGWFPTANEGFFGGTPSLLNISGDGTNYYEFIPNLKTPAEYEVYGWWVASDNRTKDTPFIINHEGIADTVRVDQSTNGSSWQLIGAYNFDGSEGESVIISNAANTQTFVVADAIRFVTYDTSFVTGINELTNNTQLPAEFRLEQNYPNPFNPQTTIRYNIPYIYISASKDISSEIGVKLTVYDILGREITTLVNNKQKPGRYQVNWNAENMASGIYFYSLKAGEYINIQKMILAK